MLSTLGISLFGPRHNPRRYVPVPCRFYRYGSRSTERLSDSPEPHSSQEEKLGIEPETGSPLPRSKEGKTLLVQWPLGSRSPKGPARAGEGDLQGSRLANWVSPLLVLDEDLVEGGPTGGGQGLLHLL